MLSAAENRMIAEVRPGTPAGEWFRRFWNPIAVSDNWDGIRTHWDYSRPLMFNGEPGTVGSWSDRLGNFSGKPTPVRILGEDLVLFRDGAGRPGLISSVSASRHVNGIRENSGTRHRVLLPRLAI